jgi:hypothetical protein
MCNGTWEYSDASSENFVQLLLIIHSGFALMDEESNEILSLTVI